MNVLRYIAAQGDLNIYLIDAIPDGMEQASPEADGNHILAHSETGHHHIIDGNTARVFNQDEFVSFLKVKEDAEIIHLRSFDTHEKIPMPIGDYMITRQRQPSIEGWERVAD